MHPDKLVVEKVGPDNLPACGIGCLSNRANPGYRSKTEWLRQRFSDGLRFLLVRDAAGQSLGFLEYVPGAQAWRPVAAEGWLFVHCLWVFPRGQRVGGLGGCLLKACLEEARQAQAFGVAALASEGPWMAGRDIFLKNGFQEIARADPFALVIHRLRDGPEPRLRDIASHPARYQGLHLVYASQCPLLLKSVNDLTAMAAEHGLTMQVTELRTAAEAQNAPSYYGVYSLLWNGRLLADHYVSKGRFKNLLRKEILSARP